MVVNCIGPFLVDVWTDLKPNSQNQNFLKHEKVIFRYSFSCWLWPPSGARERERERERPFSFCFKTGIKLLLLEAVGIVSRGNDFSCLALGPTKQIKEGSNWGWKETTIESKKWWKKLQRLYSSGDQYETEVAEKLKRQSLSLQGILKGEVSLYHWLPLWLVWNQLYGNWQVLFLYAKQTNPNQSKGRSILQWYFPL